MNLYMFSSDTVTNIWAGIGAGMWAVSNVDESSMKARRTRAAKIQIGQFGIIYCSRQPQFLTTPFVFLSKPETGGTVKDIWPESWAMPFNIKPLGSPRKTWNAREAAAKLPFNQSEKGNNLSSVFPITGTTVFAPKVIGDDDWAMIMSKLAEV